MSWAWSLRNPDLVLPQGVISLWILLRRNVWVPRPDFLPLDRVEAVAAAAVGLSLLLLSAWLFPVLSIWFGLPAVAGLSDPENLNDDDFAGQGNQPHGPLLQP